VIAIYPHTSWAVLKASRVGSKQHVSGGAGTRACITVRIYVGACGTLIDTSIVCHVKIEAIGTCWTFDALIARLF
jgi:hypothetical protein